MKISVNQLQLFGIIGDTYLYVENSITTLKDYIYELLTSAETKEQIALAVDRARDISGFIKNRYYRPLTESISNITRSKIRKRFTMRFLTWIRDFTIDTLYYSKDKNINRYEFNQFKLDKASGKLPFNLKYIV